jgi:transcriptional regulator with XRE-family HTH domain
MKTPQSLEINGEAIRLKREERGWAQTDLASRACLSVKQVRQLEEGGLSAFYSESVKATSAKRVAELLGADISEVFVTPVDVAAEAHAASLQPTSSQNLSEVSELLQTPNSMHMVEEEEDTGRSRNWLIAMGVILAVAAVVLFKSPSSQESSAVVVPASAPTPELSASDAAPDASQAASSAAPTASESTQAASAATVAASSGVAALSARPASAAATVRPAAMAASHAASATMSVKPLAPASAATPAVRASQPASTSSH